MAKKNKSELMDIFKFAFVGGTGAFLGGALAFTLVGLFSLFFCGIGYYLIVKNNKKNTKPFEDLQTEQYFGAFLFSIGLLPWVRFFFMGFLLNAGESFYDDNF
tara:strand:- start:12299 stop:12607 length:309 start_codon:yes stop_codon:yes gene_type:complete